MRTESAHSIIPAGELPCLWMDAGVVSYKLCDREYRCEDCPLSRQLHRGRGETDTTPLSVPSAPDAGNGTLGAEEIFERAVDNRLDALASRRTPEHFRIHRNHYWAFSVDARTIRIGIDHMAAELLKPFLGVVLPQAPTTIGRHEPFCWLVLPQGTVTVSSPVAAHARRFNPLLTVHPSLLGSDPYGDGWIMEIDSTPSGRAMSEFAFPGSETRLLPRQTEGIRNAFIAAFHKRQAGIGSTLLDGGTVMSDLESILGPQIYFDIVSNVFRVPLGN